MSERLKEIKDTHDKIIEAHATGDIKMELGYLLRELFADEHTDWLIQQAERVEKLEKEVKQLQKTRLQDGECILKLKESLKLYMEENSELQYRNKRYREALEFYADFYKYNYGGDADSFDKVGTSIITGDGGSKARQALRGESDE